MALAVALHTSLHGPFRPHRPSAFVSVIGGLAAARTYDRRGSF
jgi:hypothetical protein